MGLKTGLDEGDDDRAPSVQHRLSRAAMVTIGLNGAALPKSARFPIRWLDLAGVELLAELSSGEHLLDQLVVDVAARCGSSSETLEDLVTDLLARGLLVTSDSRAMPVSATDTAGTHPIVAELGADQSFVLAVPTVFRIHKGSFEHRRHDGTLLLSLSPSELIAAASWRLPSTPEEAFAKFVLEHPVDTPDRTTYDALAMRLQSAGLLGTFGPAGGDNGIHGAKADEIRDAMGRHMRINHATKVAVEAQAAELARDPAAAGRAPVIPIHQNWVSPPLSLGLVVAYAKAFEGGVLEQSYDFVPRWLVQPDQVPEITERPAIFLFSNYLWNHNTDLEYSARIKELSPTSLTIHGGPDTPKYEADVERYFGDNPHVDITIRGEGEVTFAETLAALAGQVGDAPADLSVLEDVPGLAFRLGDRVVSTPDRDRITDLNTIPSPFLTGLFDSFAAGPSSAAMLETNRGCPYGCTFCDWGSATLSRIRQFDIDRVFAEIEWCAKREFNLISLCDANFGIFERDVAIAEKYAEMKMTYGYPQIVGNNYAKNTVKHLKSIIKIFAEAGILAEGIVSLQSMDTQTLKVIRRKNIKVEKYTDLAAEFSANKLPLAADLMMGLPGSTVDSFRRDLQECADRDVRTRVHATQMLTNSPMNDPSYREENGLVALPGEFVKRSTTFDEDDWDHMWDLRRVFLLCDLFATLRHVARYVRSETGMLEITFYDQLMRDAFADPDRWPTIAFTFQSVPDILVPPCSWSLFIDEVGSYLTTVLGIADDAATQTVLDVQLAHLPSRDREFPVVLDLPHDHVAWHRERSAEYDAGNHEDWHLRVPPLRSFGPGSMTIDDPEDVCRIAIGGDVTTFGMKSSDWDFDSPVGRPRTILRQPQAGSGSPALEPSVVAGTVTAPIAEQPEVARVEA